MKSIFLYMCILLKWLNCNKLCLITNKINIDKFQTKNNTFTENAVPIKSWFEEENDTSLVQVLPTLGILR